MNDPRLTTASGTWQGAWKRVQPDRGASGDDGGGAGGAGGQIAVFRGVRYAAPPVGDRRWAPPAPPEPFAGVRPALGVAPSCPQPAGWDAPYRAAARLAGVDPALVAMEVGRQDEDCLALDVWTPKLDPAARQPVMVWLHGGASAFGTGSCALFDGSRLAAEHGVAVVSINYRLGVLGFLAHPELTTEGGGTSGNYGFLDQVAALGWVRDNATGFGGDPDNVTVFGESAGGRAVFELLAHRPARGLFQRAIAQSPWEETHHHRRLAERHDGLESAHDLGRRLAAELGLGAGPALAAMRGLSAAELLAAGDRLGFAGSLWGPVVDGEVFADHPLAMLARGESDAVPLIVGWNADEATIFFLGDLPFPTPEAYRGWVLESHPRTADELLALYPPSADERRLHRSFSDLYGDRTFVFPGLMAAKALAERGDVRVYRFSHVHPPFSDQALAASGRSVGAYHAAEIPFVFATLPRGGIDAVDGGLGRAIRAYWTGFARDGNPDGEGRPRWPLFRRGEERYLDLGDRIREASRPAADRYPALARTLAPRLGAPLP